MLDHAVAAVRRDGADLDRALVGLLHDVLGMGEAHRARMERGDLVVVQVGGDVGLGGVAVRHHLEELARDAVLVHPGFIGAEVMADGGHGQGIAAQQAEVVSDIAGGAAEFAAQLGHQEGHIQDVHLVRQDFVLELAGEHHDGVECHGTADQR